MSSSHGRASSHYRRQHRPSSSVGTAYSSSSREQEYYGAPFGGQQSGFVVEAESQGSSSRSDHSGTSSSRSQRRVRRGLNDTNLARLDEQSLVRGPLRQLEVASQEVMRSVHSTNVEIDQLSQSILELQQELNSLRERMTAAQSLEEWTQLGEQQKNILDRIGLEQERKQVLLDRLEQGRQAVNRTLIGLNLYVNDGSRSTPDLPSYPANADLAEGSEAVHEEGRPHLAFQ